MANTATAIQIKDADGQYRDYDFIELLSRVTLSLKTVQDTTAVVRQPFTFSDTNVLHNITPGLPSAGGAVQVVKELAVTADGPTLLTVQDDATPPVVLDYISLPDGGQYRFVANDKSYAATQGRLLQMKQSGAAVVGGYCTHYEDVWNPGKANLIYDTVKPGVNVWQDAAQTIIGNSESDPVRSWFVGGAATFTNTADASRPTIANVGGQFALRFDGVNDWLKAALALNTSYTIGLAVSIRSFPAGVNLAFMDGFHRLYALLTRDLTTHLRFVDDGLGGVGGNYRDTGFVPAAGTAFTLVIRHTGTEFDAWVNGAHSFAPAADTPAGPLDGITLGADAGFTTGSPVMTPTPLDVFGIAYAPRVIADPDVSNLHVWLNSTVTGL